MHFPIKVPLKINYVLISDPMSLSNIFKVLESRQIVSLYNREKEKQRPQYYLIE